LKEKKDIVEERTDKRELPVLRISVTNLEITVEEGRVYHSSFALKVKIKYRYKGSSVLPTTKSVWRRRTLPGHNRDSLLF